jgi:hypothetical protein
MSAQQTLQQMQQHAGLTAGKASHATPHAKSSKASTRHQHQLLLSSVQRTVLLALANLQQL